MYQRPSGGSGRPCSTGNWRGLSLSAMTSSAYTVAQTSVDVALGPDLDVLTAVRHRTTAWALLFCQWVPKPRPLDQGRLPAEIHFCSLELVGAGERLQRGRDRGRGFGGAGKLRVLGAQDPSGPRTRKSTAPYNDPSMIDAP